MKKKQKIIVTLQTNLIQQFGTSYCFRAAIKTQKKKQNETDTPLIFYERRICIIISYSVGIHASHNNHTLCGYDH